MKTSEVKTWNVFVDEEGVLNFPEDLQEVLGWKEGDEIELIDQKDGSFLLVKCNDNDGSNQAPNDAGND